MLLLGHTGITLGAAVLLAGATTSNLPTRTEGSEITNHHQHASEAFSASSCTSSKRTSWLTTLGDYIDVRILLVGSLLPDIIDKPVGIFLFPQTFDNGRIFCHTLLFLILLTIAGTYIHRRYHKTWLLVLSFGTFTHLICDQMWLTPHTLFWPLYGFTFETVDISNWIPNMLYALLTEAEVYVPELLGGIILIWFTWVLLRRKRIYAFIRHGEVE